MAETCSHYGLASNRILPPADQSCHHTAEAGGIAVDRVLAGNCLCLQGLQGLQAGATGLSSWVGGRQVAMFARDGLARLQSVVWRCSDLTLLLPE